MPNNYSSAALPNHPQFFSAWLQGVYWGHQWHETRVFAKIFLYEKEGGMLPMFEEDDLSALNDCGDPYVLGDVNGDGIVNVVDILAVVNAWGLCFSCPEDLNGDGVVNVVDLLDVVGSWT
jgi:hypothetical protein